MRSKYTYLLQRWFSFLHLKCWTGWIMFFVFHVTLKKHKPQYKEALDILGAVASRTKKKPSANITSALFRRVILVCSTSQFFAANRSNWFYPEPTKQKRNASVPPVMNAMKNCVLFSIQRGSFLWAKLFFNKYGQMLCRLQGSAGWFWN